MRAFSESAIARNPRLVDFGALSTPYSLGVPGGVELEGELTRGLCAGPSCSAPAGRQVFSSTE